MPRIFKVYLADWLIGASSVVALAMVAVKLPELWTRYHAAITFVHGKIYLVLWFWTHANDINFPMWMSMHYIAIEYLIDVAGLLLMIPLGIGIRSVLRSQAIGLTQEAVRRVPLLGQAVTLGLDVVQILVNTVDRIKEEETGIPVLIWSGSGTDEVAVLQDWGSPIEIQINGFSKKHQSANVWVSGTWKVVDPSRIIPLSQILYKADDTDEFVPLKVDFSNLFLRQRLRGGSKDETMDLAIEVARAAALYLVKDPRSTEIPPFSGVYSGRKVELIVSPEFLSRRSQFPLNSD
jgi:hypothetical protein